MSRPASSDDTAAAKAYSDDGLAQLTAHMDEKTAEMIRHMYDVGEGLRTEIRQIAESINLFNRKLDGLAVQLDQLHQELLSEIRLALPPLGLGTRAGPIQSKPTT